ncbi:MULTISPECIES: glutamyl-tRNA reductase [Thiothrix]|jgi:glutamyl-tRNA reductase|uniref:Glutamyl-tRNA reductase n=2 Tax=Thiothrix TaxID=1030 RepID=A0A975F6M8_9GAMM|nr:MULTISPECIES: glutamyl-tRNA reductase [Thiothrix]OQX03048.1 MAG: glutamyl-tRNA reductase [Thiothrix lacustris]QTR52172.1 glutamyl-tRNA reductase [Thiothrix unzii]
MPILIVGVNHKTAPVAIREKVSFSPDAMTRALHSARQVVQESVILSTCNRTEIYVVCPPQQSVQSVVEWLAQWHSLPVSQLQPYLYLHQDEAAVRHTLRVACGLDSLVLGEPQILGQLKSALQVATEQAVTGNHLNRLMQHAFSTAKKVRTQTSIGANPISVAFAAVSLAKQIFSQLEKQTALLIGAGETIELVGKHLATNKIGHVLVANRSVDKAQKLAAEYGGKGISLQELADHLPKADIVISSTASPVPILGKGTVERALKIRKHRPMFMVDIAVPRDIEQEVAELDDVYLYTVDDLQSVIEENLQSRRAAAEQAEGMVGTETSNFMAWLRAQDHMDTIREYRARTEQTRQETLDKALALLHHGKTPEEALQFLAHTLSNKLSHDATQAMHHAARNGDHALLAHARALFNLSTTDTND